MSAENDREQKRKDLTENRRRQVHRQKILLLVCLALAVCAAAVFAAAKTFSKGEKTETNLSSSAGTDSAADDADADDGTSSSGNAADETANGTENSGSDAEDSTAENSDADSESEESEEADDADTASGDRTIQVSLVGDVTLGLDENFSYGSAGFDAYYEANGADYFLSGVRSIFETDDLTIINMEGTLTEEETRADKTYAFKADPSYVEILTGSSVEAANLANNHSHDYGEQSYTDTINTLEENGIETFGYDDVALMDVEGVSVALIGIYELDEGTGVSDDLSENIQTAKDAGAEVIIVSFHWGSELESCPDSIQVTLAHQAIDEGADLVVGHHPHVLQGIEYYEGKTIAYSLGNFCFGGNRNPSDKDTMILQMSFTTDENGTVTDTELTVIPCSISSSSSKNDYQPTVLTGDDAQDVYDKLDARSTEISETYGTDTVYSSTEE